MLHPLLNQQITTYLGNNPPISPALASLFNCISESYHQMDDKRTESRDPISAGNDFAEMPELDSKESFQEIFERLINCKNLLNVSIQSSNQNYGHTHGNFLSLLSELQRGIITLKATEEESFRKLSETVRVNREMDQFGYIVSHELKSPLRAIANLSQWIEDDLTDLLNQESKNQFRLLRNRIYRMESLINAILTYSKSTKQKDEMSQVDTNWLLKEVIDSLDCPDHVSININGKFPIIETEAVKLQQVFANLISNAIKYNNKKEGKVEISLFETEEHCQFCVSDNGPGIEPQFHQKVFMIFQTLETRDEYESTGIGLAIVKKIIEDTGGKIWIESEKNKGAKFVFLSGLKKELLTVLKSLIMPEERIIDILLIEDDSVDIMNVQRAFRKNNINNPLHIARNGIEALDMLRGSERAEQMSPMPKIILLDINMPKMNGIEFLREIRNDESLKSISVFIMTTSNDDHDKFQAYNMNVAGYIVKPISFEKFVHAVSVLNSYWLLCEQPD